MRLSFSILFLLIAAVLTAQQSPVTGPVIEGFGPVFDVPNPGFATPTDQIYRVAFDIAGSPGGPGDINPLIVTAARFYNMHARAGVPVENLRVALVLHGQAAEDVLGNDAYRQRFQTDNPNLELLRQLKAAGADIYLCGQSAANRGFSAEELAEPVQLALSAMTALVTLGGQGYMVLSW